ncbi:MAG: hypothetical protein ABIR63_07340 [Sphingomicrobium sp.]
MSGYRQSSFDPNAHAQPGPPLRPFNWVQWIGVAFLVITLLLLAAQIAGWLGLAPRGNYSVGIPGLAVGSIVLIHSRPQPATDLAPELAAERKRWLIITVAVVAFILGAATLIELNGAH